MYKLITIVTCLHRYWIEVNNKIQGKTNKSTKIISDKITYYGFNISTKFIITVPGDAELIKGGLLSEN